MDEHTRGQVIDSAAEIYDRFFLPALFEEWPPRVLAAAQAGPGECILDVACGTGVLALGALETVGLAGSVVGLDINDGMLAVAQRKSAQVEWRHGRAEDLPYLEGAFDCVVSQFGLMFFDDRRAAIQEMVRVLTPGGRLAVAVWDSLENTPGYAAVTALLERLFGPETAQALEAPYALGNTQELASLFDVDGLAEVKIQTLPGTARFPSLDSWMFTDVKGWTLAGVIDDEGFDRLLAEARIDLRKFVTEDGTVAFPAPAHIVSAQKTTA